MRTLPVILLFVLPMTIQAQPRGWGQAQLVADLNTQEVGSSPQQLTSAGGKVFFKAWTPERGHSFWVSDGSGGFRPISDISEDLSHQDARLVGSLDEKALILIGHTTLLATNGEPGGTEVLQSGDTQLTRHGVAGSRMFFSDYVDGKWGLWATDGTTAGTALLRDRFDYGFESTTVVGTRLYFALVGFSDLWVSDGTQTGTTPVGPMPVTRLWSTLAFDDKLILVGERLGDFNESLWSFDPQTLGATLLASSVHRLAAARVGNLIITSSTEGDQDLLLRTDGSPQGTHVFASFPSSGRLDWRAVSGGLRYFSYTHPETGRELWRTDGTVAGTFLVKDINPGPRDSTPRALLAEGSLLYFSATNVDAGEELWVTDGTEAGTRMLDLFPGPVGSRPFGAASVGGDILLGASVPGIGNELIRYSPTTGNVSVAADLATGETQGSFPRYITPTPTGVVLATGLGDERRLWRSDGRGAGTQAIAGPLRPPFQLFLNDDGQIFFSEWDGAAANVWRLDNQPTLILTGSAPRPSLASLNDLVIVSFGERTYAGSGASGGFELLHEEAPSADEPLVVAGNQTAYFRTPSGWYATDGTRANTRPIPNSLADYTMEAATVGDALLAFEDRDGRRGLWRMDASLGLEPQLVVEANFRYYRVPARMRTFGTHVFFIAETDGSGGHFPWITDGTPEGSRQLLDAQTVDLGYPHHFPIATRGRLFFSHDDQSLWVLEDLEGDPRMVAQSQVLGGRVEPLAAIDGELVYLYDDGVRGEELWITDGADTHILADLNPGPGSSSPTEVTRVGDRLFIAANVPPYGSELWVLHYDPLGPAVETATPVAFSVSEPFPNPAGHQTRLIVHTNPGTVTATIRDVLGRRVSTVNVESVHGGPADVSISTAGLASGIYFVTVRSGDAIETRNLVVTR